MFVIINCIVFRWSCHICEKDCTTWSKLRNHFLKIHKTNPLVYCICGTPLSSKTVLYKHISDHKLESKKLHIQNEDDDEKPDIKYYSLKVKDFVRYVFHSDVKDVL